MALFIVRSLMRMKLTSHTFYQLFLSPLFETTLEKTTFVRVRCLFFAALGWKSSSSHKNFAEMKSCNALWMGAYIQLGSTRRWVGGQFCGRRMASKVVLKVLKLSICHNKFFLCFCCLFNFCDSHISTRFVTIESKVRAEHFCYISFFSCLHGIALVSRFLTCFPLILLQTFCRFSPPVALRSCERMTFACLRSRLSLERAWLLWSWFLCWIDRHWIVSVLARASIWQLGKSHEDGE